MAIDDEVKMASDDELIAYLQGALKDGTFNNSRRTHRIGQRERSWLEMQRDMLSRLGFGGWIYREGSSRDFWILETTASFLSVTFDGLEIRDSAGKLAYARGFFDAEGGVPATRKSRFYIQLVQKNLATLAVLRSILVDEGIACGRLHNPSVAVDPNYWRFYVAARSHCQFAQRVGSWHPRKRKVLDARCEAATGLSGTRAS